MDAHDELCELPPLLRRRVAAFFRSSNLIGNSSVDVLEVDEVTRVGADDVFAPPENPDVERLRHVRCVRDKKPHHMRF